MKRRKFVRVITTGSIGAMAFGQITADAKNLINRSAKKEVKMTIGCQHFTRSKKDMEFLARYGVFHIDGGVPEAIEGVGWDIAKIRADIETAEQYGISIDSYHLPLGMGSGGIPRVSNIMLGKSPERDKEIEMIKQMIEVAGKVGLSKLLYNMVILPVMRTGHTNAPDRGDSQYNTWDIDRAKQGLTEAGKVSKDEIYERITYFLDRVLPVAEKRGVRLGCHIADPPTPIGYRGITRWDSPNVIESIKRFAKLYDSDSHGFNLDVGITGGEGLEGDNRTEKICNLIKWLGDRNQIFNIHLRNIKGGFGHFMEVYPDNGILDFVQVVKTLRDVDYDGMLMPDHIPGSPDPMSNREGHAFAWGYNKALIQAVAEMP